MASRCVISVEPVDVGEPETGLWCGRCLLPSGYRRRVAFVSGLHILLALQITACHDCGAHSNERIDL